MNIVDAIWTMVGAACLTIATIYFLVWLRKPALKSHLLLALTAASVGVVGLIELAAMHADSPARYAELIRWGQVGVAATVVGTICFIRLRYAAGNPVLAWLTAATRVACLVPNFLGGANLNYAYVQSLKTITFLGTDVRIPDIAKRNPWAALDDGNVLLLAVFVGLAMIDLARRPPSPNRTRGMWTCAALLLFVLWAGIWGWLVVTAGIQMPLIFAPTFLSVLLVMGYKLSDGLTSAQMLTDRLDTTTKRLRTALREMTKTVRATGIGLLYFDVETGRVQLSHHARVLLGVSSKNSSTLAEIVAQVPSPDQNRLLDTIKHAVMGEDIRCEFRVATGEDNHRWLAMRGGIVVDAAGRRILDGVLAEVTERKSAESQFRQAVEAADGAQLVVTPFGKVAFTNKMAAEIFERSPEELVGMDFSSLVPTTGSEDEAVRSGHRSSIGVIEAGKGIVGMRKGGEETVPLKVMLNPVPFETDVFQLVSLVGLSDDRSTGNDEAILRDEVAHLSRVALMATLSGSLAHELNQPLAAILANAQAARRILDGHSPDMNEVSESLAAIVENDKRAAELIKRLRALLRRDNSGFRPFDVGDTIDESLRLCGSELLTREVEISIEGRAPLPPVNGDSIQIQQVLLNVLMNACDAMDNQSTPKKIALRIDTIADAYVQVSVTDHGTGIAAEDLPRVFHPFFTSKRDGLGLGLSVCSTIVVAHGGDMSVHSDGVGKGASVSFRLPFVPATAPDTTIEPTDVSVMGLLASPKPA